MFTLAGYAVIALMFLLALKKGFTVVKKSELPPNIRNWENDVYQAQRETGVPAKNIAAVLWVESAGNANAIGGAGEIGLMQLKEIAVRDVRENFHIKTDGWKDIPAKNILVGAYYLKLMKRRTGNWPDAFRAYNQGVTGAKKNVDLANQYLAKINTKLEAIG